MDNIYFQYNKIIVIGSPGCGKSWFSKRLAVQTGLPLIHLDNEFWQPNWTKTPIENWIAKLEELTSRKKWIIDGNYNNTLEMRFLAAELIIFLDVNKLQCILSILRRNRKKRTDLPEYLKEPKLFSKNMNEFLKSVWRFPKYEKRIILNLHDKYPENVFIQIKGRKSANKFFRE